MIRALAFLLLLSACTTIDKQVVGTLSGDHDGVQQKYFDSWKRG